MIYNIIRYNLQPVYFCTFGLSTESEEYIKSAKVFSTLHSATCHISHVDPEIVQHLGYLPQDMIGRSLFDFYHPEDLHSIKEIYETVSMKKNPNYRKKLSFYMDSLF